LGIKVYPFHQTIQRSLSIPVAEVCPTGKLTQWVLAWCFIQSSIRRQDLYWCSLHLCRLSSILVCYIYTHPPERL